MQHVLNVVHNLSDTQILNANASTPYRSRDAFLNTTASRRRECTIVSMNNSDHVFWGDGSNRSQPTAELSAQALNRSSEDEKRWLAFESVLSNLGVGIPQPTPTWGNMISDGRSFIDTAWWISTMPGIAIFLLVLSLNFIGDWLRDRWDPKLRQL